MIAQIEYIHLKNNISLDGWQSSSTNNWIATRVESTTRMNTHVSLYSTISTLGENTSCVFYFESC
jgi:hypothetical protein